MVHATLRIRAGPSGSPATDSHRSIPHEFMLPAIGKAFVNGHPRMKVGRDPSGVKMAPEAIRELEVIRAALLRRDSGMTASPATSRSDDGLVTR